MYQLPKLHAPKPVSILGRALEITNLDVPLRSTLIVQGPAPILAVFLPAFLS